MELVRVTDRQSGLFADAIAILHEAISSDALLPKLRFHDLLAHGNYQLFAYVQDEDAQGVALVYFSDALRFAWLDYFAIRSDLRGKGLGSKLFREIVQFAKKQNSQPDWLLFEVDDDYEGNPEREAECIRRVAFYRRLGARVLENVPYKFPSVFTSPIRMRLMACKLHPNTKLEPDDLKHAVREIFLNIHGRASDDKLLHWFEQSAPETIELS